LERIDEFEEKPADKKELLKFRNKVSAKRSRAKKKEYINTLEKLLHKTKKEAEYQRALNKNTSVLYALMDNFSKTEKDFMKFSSFNEGSKGAKQEYYEVQTQLLQELFKKMMKCLIPLNFKSFDDKLLNLMDITAFESFEELHGKIEHNQMTLKEHINMIGLESSTVSSPLKHFIFLEQLKQFAFKFRELIGEVKKLTI